MQNVLTSYTENEILTAEPEKLVLLMYDGAIKFIRQGKAAIREAHIEDAHTYILRAYAIIAELQATLDKEKGGEIAAGLERSYDFILNHLKEADIKKDEILLDEVENLLVPLAETWKKAFFSRNSSRSASDYNLEKQSRDNLKIQSVPKIEPVARQAVSPDKPSASVDLRG